MPKRKYKSNLLNILTMMHQLNAKYPSFEIKVNKGYKFNSSMKKIENLYSLDFYPLSSNSKGELRRKNMSYVELRLQVSDLLQ
ncbi:MAG: hypothetical protein GY714_20030 [Desulfobacterales bacterium]|nr:hypothetical protein [Desulfobacterales bacterium]